MKEVEKKIFKAHVDPIELAYPGLNQKTEEFEDMLNKRIMDIPRSRIAAKIEQDLQKRFCSICFFGSVLGVIEGVPMCEDCANNMYEFENDGRMIRIKNKKPSYEWHVKRRRAEAFEFFYKKIHENFYMKNRLEASGVDIDKEIRKELYGLDPI